MVPFGLRMPGTAGGLGRNRPERPAPPYELLTGERFPERISRFCARFSRADKPNSSYVRPQTSRDGQSPARRQTLRHDSAVMRRALGLLSLLLLVAAGAPPSAGAALFFLFNPTSAKPGDRVAIRTGGTPLRFKATQRIRPFQQPVRLFLVANGVAPNVNSSQDPRLHPIGS